MSDWSFFPRARATCPLDDARALAGLARGRALSVALLVDPGDALVEDILSRAAPDMFQLHGSETPERTAAIRKLTGRPVIKAVKVSGADDVRSASRYIGAADLVLFDATPPKTPGALPGGNGLAFDWRALAEAGHPGPFMLSGGLNADNVGEAIAVTGATMVDASSGVERAPGEKDEDLIRRFIRAAKCS